MPQDDLDRMLAVVRQDRPADAVWPVAAAAIELMWWHDRFVDAHELAVDTIRRFRTAPGKLFDQDSPFDEAVLVGVETRGDDPLRAVEALGELVPVRSVLGERLSWLLGALPGRAPHSLTSGCDVDLSPARRARPLNATEKALVESDPTSLAPEELRRWWVAARRAGRPETSVRVHDAGIRPRDWMNAFWLARQLIKSERVDDAAAVLLNNLDLWFSERPWHIAPLGITTQPDMRMAATPELRAAVLANVDIDAVPGVG